jgi:hypothetical protein
VRINVDAQALIAREQAVTGAVSQAMLTVTSLRHPASRQRTWPSPRSCLLGRVQARGREPRGNWSGLGARCGNSQTARASSACLSSSPDDDATGHPNPSALHVLSRVTWIRQSRRSPHQSSPCERRSLLVLLWGPSGDHTLCVHRDNPHVGTPTVPNCNQADRRKRLVPRPGGQGVRDR